MRSLSAYSRLLLWASVWLATAALALTSAACKTASNDGDDDDEQDTSPETGADGATTTGPVCTTTADTCDGDVVSSCVEGAPEQRISCPELCMSSGFEAGPCTPSAEDGGAARCGCGLATDETCASAVEAYCVCAEAAEMACTNQEQQALYVACFEDRPDIEILLCFNDFVTGRQVDCAPAIEACLPRE